MGTIRVDRTLLTIFTSNGASLKPFGKHCIPEWTCLPRRFCRSVNNDVQAPVWVHVEVSHIGMLPHCHCYNIIVLILVDTV